TIVKSQVTRQPVLDDSLRLSRHFGDTTYNSELYRRRGLVLYERAVPIRDNGRLMGHLVEVRKLVVATAARLQLERLVGANAALLVGNNNDSWWFDLTGGSLHEGPFVVAPRYTRDGQSWLSAAVALPAA